MKVDRNGAPALTENDRRVLEATEYARQHWDGFAPHGSRDWVAIKRLEAEGLIELEADFGTCQTCS